MKKDWFSLKEIIIMLIGLIISGLAFLFYFLIKENWVNILTAGVSVLFTLFLMYFVLGNKKEYSKIQRFIYPTCLIVIFYAFVFAVLLMIKPFGDFSYDYLFFTCYLGCSIVPIYYILIIIMGILSYGL